MTKWKERRAAKRAAKEARAAETPRSPLQAVLKSVAGVTAVLSLIFGLQKLVELILEISEQRAAVIELHRIGKVQQNSSDYRAAWSSFNQANEAVESMGRFTRLAGRFGREQALVREAQEDLAMAWLENMNASENESFTKQTDPLVPVLARGIIYAEGQRKADLLAHMGWANFLRWRDGQRSLNPAQQYQEAIAADSVNPYAHAYLGHWAVWDSRKLADGEPHFKAALSTDRARAHVRRIQIAAISNLGGMGDLPLLGVVMEMQANGERASFAARSLAWRAIRNACFYNSEFERKRVLDAYPADRLLASLQTLMAADEAETSRLDRAGCTAMLLEQTGRRDEALQAWTTLRAGLDADDDRWHERARVAIARLSAQRT